MPLAHDEGTWCVHFAQRRARHPRPPRRPLTPGKPGRRPAAYRADGPGHKYVFDTPDATAGVDKGVLIRRRSRAFSRNKLRVCGKRPSRSARSTGISTGTAAGWRWCCPSPISTAPSGDDTAPAPARGASYPLAGSGLSLSCCMPSSAFRSEPVHPFRAGPRPCRIGASRHARGHGSGTGSSKPVRLSSDHIWISHSIKGNTGADSTIKITSNRTVVSHLPMAYLIVFHLPPRSPSGSRPSPGTFTRLARARRSA